MPDVGARQMEQFFIISAAAARRSRSTRTGSTTLALHGGGERRRTAQNVSIAVDDRDCPACRPESPYGGLVTKASAALRHHPARAWKSNARCRTREARSGRDHRVAVPAEDGGYGAVAAARLPHLSLRRRSCPEQRLGHPGRRRIEIIATRAGRPTSEVGRAGVAPHGLCGRGADGGRIRTIERQADCKSDTLTGAASSCGGSW